MLGDFDRCLRSFPLRVEEVSPFERGLSPVHDLAEHTAIFSVSVQGAGDDVSSFDPEIQARSFQGRCLTPDNAGDFQRAGGDVDPAHDASD